MIKTLTIETQSKSAACLASCAVATFLEVWLEQIHSPVVWLHLCYGGVNLNGWLLSLDGHGLRKFQRFLRLLSRSGLGARSTADLPACDERTERQQLLSVFQ